MPLKTVFNSVTNISRKIPLRAILIILFVGQIVTAVGFTGWISFSNGQSAVNDLANQLRKELTTKIEQHLHNYLEMPHLANQLNADIVRLGILNLEDTVALEKYLWHQKQNFKTISYLGIGTQLGDYVGAQIFPNDTSIIEILDKTEGHNFKQTWEVDYLGNRSRLQETSNKTYDPRDRPWYRAAIKAEGPVWADIYAYFSKESMTLSANQPIYDQNDKLVGVTSADLTLSELSLFLNQLKIGSTGKAFIMERSGKLVASSTVSQPFIKQSNEIKRIEAKDSQDELISATANYLLQEFKRFERITTSQQLSFDLNGAKEFVQVAPLRDERGLDWLIVLVIPENDFMEKIHENTQYTMLLMIAALFISIIIGLVTAHWIIKPILQLNGAAKEIAAGKWNQALPIHRPDEIGELANSFSSMEKQLKDLFDNLEKRVAKRTEQLSNAYRSLKASQAQLIQSEKMASLGQMVAGIAHEINTPLGYVKNNVEMTQELMKQVEELFVAYDQLFILMTSGEIDEVTLNTQLTAIDDLSRRFRQENTFSEMQELSQDTLHGIGRIAELVVNLKNFSRMDQAAIDNVDLNECINSVLIIAHNMLKYKTEVYKLYGQIPKVECAPSQINQVLLNLLSNAVQAIEKKGTISITTRADTEYVHIDVEDSGKGIPKEVLPKIFDPFFTTKPVGEGTGLGLSVSYKIVRQHNGKIKVVSQLNKGTKFTVSLPIRQKHKAT